MGYSCCRPCDIKSWLKIYVGTVTCTNLISNKDVISHMHKSKFLGQFWTWRGGWSVFLCIRRGTYALWLMRLELELRRGRDKLLKNIIIRHIYLLTRNLNLKYTIRSMFVMMWRCRVLRSSCQVLLVAVHFVLQLSYWWRFTNTTFWLRCFRWTRFWRNDML